MRQYLLISVLEELYNVYRMYISVFDAVHILFPYWWAWLERVSTTCNNVSKIPETKPLEKGDLSS